MRLLDQLLGELAEDSQDPKTVQTVLRAKMQDQIQEYEVAAELYRKDPANYQQLMVERAKTKFRGGLDA
jgi:hypothetical protein